MVYMVDKSIDQRVVTYPHLTCSQESSGLNSWDPCHASLLMRLDPRCQFEVVKGNVIKNEICTMNRAVLHWVPHIHLRVDKYNMSRMIVHMEDGTVHGPLTYGLLFIVMIAVLLFCSLETHEFMN